MCTSKIPSNCSSCGAAGGAGPVGLVLPVAPRSLARIRFDQSEGKARAIPPFGALRWLDEHSRQGVEVSKVTLEGPGDPLSDLDTTLETIDLIRNKYPGLVIALTTLGLYGGEFAGKLCEAGVSEVVFLVDGVDPEVIGKLYAWIRPGNKTVPLPKAAPLLVDEQAEAAKSFAGEGCRVTVRTTVYPGVNDGHIERIAKTMAALGAESMELVPYRPGDGGEESLLDPPGCELMQKLQAKAAKYLPATLASPREEGLSANCPSPLGKCEPMQPKPSKERPNLAVVSSNGMEIDLHLGQAIQVLVYGPREDGLPCLLGTRLVPEPGSGSSRWEELARTLKDCFALLAASAGESPRRILDQQGISVLITEGDVTGTVDLLYGGGKKKKVF